MVALARYKKDGSYGYLAAMRKDKLNMHAAHKVVAQQNRRQKNDHKATAEDKVHAHPAHKIVAETRPLK